MKWHAAVRVGGIELPINVGEDEALIELPIDTKALRGRISHHVWETLERHHLLTSPTAAVDLFRLAAAVYAVDQRVSRWVQPGQRTATSDNWTRNLELHLPVSATWNDDARQTAVDLLHWLTGDVWSVSFYDAPEARPTPRDRRKTFEPLDATAVCLLSGGLDSFIGASNALATDELLYLVSHTAAGSAAHSSTPQKHVAQALGNRYDVDRIRHLQLTVSPPPKSCSGQNENTQRSRSIMFLGLGTLVAASVDGVHRLIVPENGFISINPPLTDARIGSHSTRTTHPYTIQLYRRLLEELGIDVEVLLPHRFDTKGEMLEQAEDVAWVKQQAQLTISCAHPSADRWEGDGNQPDHCGYCVPCIVRRAALLAANAPTEAYRHDILSDEFQQLPVDSDKRADPRAVRVAIARNQRTPSDITDLLATGPLLTGPGDDLDRYIEVVRRGFAEIEELLARA